MVAKEKMKSEISSRRKKNSCCWLGVINKNDNENMLWDENILCGQISTWNPNGKINECNIFIDKKFLHGATVLSTDLHTVEE